MCKPAFKQVVSDHDIETVAELAREIWLEHYVPIVGRAQIDYMLDRFQSAPAIHEQINGTYDYYLLMYDRVPAGYIAILPDRETGRMMLSKIYVHKNCRGKGLGKAAVAFVAALCRKEGFNMLWLTVNKHNSRSIAWYEHMGFENTGPIIQDIGGGFVMDDYKMVKEMKEADHD
jgi:GNAT superfamily N-acetyltransferase